jgi:hypothetical protein
MRRIINPDECLNTLLSIANTIRNAGQPTTECELLLAKMSDLVLELDQSLSFRYEIGPDKGLPERWGSEQIQRNRAEREAFIERNGTRF